MSDSRVNSVIDWCKRAPARLQALLEEYGPTAVGIHVVVFALVLAGFAIAIQQGVQVESAEGSVGVLAGAWVATKFTSPLRIAVTLVLTPFVARVLKKPPVGAQKSTDTKA